MEFDVVFDKTTHAPIPHTDHQLPHMNQAAKDAVKLLKTMQDKWLGLAQAKGCALEGLVLWVQQTHASATRSEAAVGGARLFVLSLQTLDEQVS